LQRHGGEDADRVHQPGDGAPLLGHLDEDLAGRAVLVKADVDVALVASDVELVTERVPVCWKPPPDRLRLPRRPTRDSPDRLRRALRGGPGPTPSRLRRLVRVCALGAGLHGVERLRLLAAVAVDRDRLQAEAPG